MDGVLGANAEVRSGYFSIDNQILDMGDTERLNVAGRSWRIVTHPTPSYLAERKVPMPWLMLLVGLAISAWLARSLARRQAATDSIRRSEERFRALIEKSGNSISLVGADGRMIYNSPNYERVMGYREGMAGRSIFSLIHPDDMGPTMALFTEVMRAPGTVRTAVFRTRHYDGSWRWLESTATNLQSDPAVGAVVANMRDITDNKLAEAALRENERRLRTILQTALDGFLIADAQLRFIDVNDAYCAMSGYSRDEILKLQITDINPIEPPTEKNAHMRQVVAAGSGRFETLLRRKDGSCFDAEVSIQYIDNGDRQLICFVRDITERIRRENEIRQMNSELERRVDERTADLSHVNAELTRALRTKDEFLATMSHELRTPLNGILAFSEMLTEQISGPLNERQLRSMEHITTSGQHLLTLINDILDLSKVEAGRMEIHTELHRVVDICESSLLFTQEIAVHKGVHVSFVNSDPSALIEVDAKRLKQMLVNLLGNAVKFTPAGGQVRLEVATDAAHGQISFAVADTGIGIAPEDMGRLFQPFTQLDSGLTRQHEGTGLGLALVRRLANLLGGGVNIESAGVGQGSRFTIALPWRPMDLRQGAPTQEGPTPDRQQQKANGRVILLAEDTEVTISAISEYLQSRHHRVAVARNGQEAVARAIELRPDLILMDIQMPVLDGLAAIRQIRALPMFTATPIVALTALAMPGDRERCLEAGANEYMSKPVSLHDLAALVARLVGS
ncbi:MAG: PAS domain S-box protein [Chloroflexales bacterium]